MMTSACSVGCRYCTVLYIVHVQSRFFHFSSQTTQSAHFFVAFFDLSLFYFCFLIESLNEIKKINWNEHSCMTDKSEFEICLNFRFWTIFTLFEYAKKRVNQYHTRIWCLVSVSCVSVYVHFFFFFCEAIGFFLIGKKCGGCNGERRGCFQTCLARFQYLFLSFSLASIMCKH